MSFATDICQDSKAQKIIYVVVVNAKSKRNKYK